MAFECTLMDDPVVAADGHTYNRVDIENWFKEHDTSPLNHEPLESKALFPNMDKRRQINAWREEHGLPPLIIGQPAKAKAGGGGGAAAAGAQILKPAAVCAFSQKPLQAFCVTCRKSICIKCLTDPARCKSHNTRPLDDILSGIRIAATRTLRGCRCWRDSRSSCRRSAIELMLPPTLPIKPFEKRPQI